MVRYRWSALAAFALLAGALPTPAAAQELDLDRAAPEGRVFAGRTGEGGEPARFGFTLEGGKAIELRAEPVDGSDPAIKVTDAASGETIAENDDSPGTLGAQVRLYSERNRRVRVEVRNAAVDSVDAVSFNLVLSPSSYRPKPALDLGIGDRRNGTLSGQDEQLYRFRASEGQVWRFELSASEGSALDPALEVYAGEAVTGEPLAADDDGGGGLNSRLRFVAPRTGTYLLRVHAIGVSSGDYSLEASEAAPIPPPSLDPIGIATPVAARIEGEGSERFYRLSDAAKAEIAARPGSLMVTMATLGEGSALDPVLAVGFDTPLGFAALLTDDDGGGGTNARLSFDASKLSRAWLDALRIRAKGYLESSGDYELTLERGD